MFQAADVLFAPERQRMRGGVATSALEMSQNAARQRWDFSSSEDKLHEIMRGVHASAWEAAEFYGRPGDYVVGSKCSRFKRVADAMLAQALFSPPADWASHLFMRVCPQVRRLLARFLFCPLSSALRNNLRGAFSVCARFEGPVTINRE